MNLERNVGQKDKNIRIAIGAVLLIIGLFKSFWLALLGAIVLATGLLSFCGLYKLLGMNTASQAEQATASDDLSQRVSDNVDDFKQEAEETIDEVKEKAEKVAAEVKEDASELIDDAKEKYAEVKEDAGELVDDAKEKIASAKDSIDKSIDKNKKS